MMVIYNWIAHSAEEALEAPLAALTLSFFVMMGPMSGFKFADSLRKRIENDIPVIFLTAKGYRKWHTYRV